MKKRCALKRLARAIRKRPILAMRYNLSTALYRGSDAEEPSHVTSHNGRARIDFLSLAVSLVALCASVKALILYLKKNRKKK